MWKQRYWGSGHGSTKTTSSPSTKTHIHNQSSSSSSSSSSTSAGCMCAVFQLFDFHPLTQLPTQSSPVSLNPLPDHHHISKGSEAPRNSLETEEDLDISRLQCRTSKQKENALHFPKGIVQIKTKSHGMAVNNWSAGNDSPTTKTPTLVARLMGLDILPQSNSPSTTPRSGNYSKATKKGGCRSLPETPRTSCERKSNVDQDNNYHHRLSLQIPNYNNKENNPNPSPTHYAKEIVKQIKESVISRKAGLNDITNTNYNNTRRDQDMMKLQTKPPKKMSSLSSSKPVLEPKKQKGVLKTTTKVAALKKGNKQEEPFVVISSKITKAAIDAPLKKTPLSNQLINKHPPFSSPIKPTPIQPPCKRNQGTDETTDKESKRHMHSNHQHLIQLQPNKDVNNPKHPIRTTAAVAAPANGSDNHEITAELDYVRQILLRRSTNSSSVYSSIFLENVNYNDALNYNISISHRKLLCHLVEEFLKPHLDLKPYRQPATVERWPGVVEKLCDKVKKLPRAKCEVLEDIDGIIEKDMDILGIGFEEDGEGIIKEIEECIVEELLKETVRFC